MSSNYKLVYTGGQVKSKKRVKQGQMKQAIKSNLTTSDEKIHRKFLQFPDPYFKFKLHSLIANCQFIKEETSKQYEDRKTTCEVKE